MIIGFSGSRSGMSKYQRDNIWDFLAHQKFVQAALHGDCIGSDEIFHEMCETLRFRIEIYPPTESTRRAWKIPTIGVIHEPETFLDRNRQIAEHCTVLLATPHTIEPVTHSGTWHTINCARGFDKTMMIVLPTPEG